MAEIVDARGRAEGEDTADAIEGARVQTAKNYLCGYQLCLQMLELHAYKRQRQWRFDELCDCSDLLEGNELVWRARMYEIEKLVSSLLGARERLILYYHYLRGESVERAAELVGVSRRTGYRAYRRGLFVVGCILERKKIGPFSESSE